MGAGIERGRPISPYDSSFDGDSVDLFACMAVSLRVRCKICLSCEVYIESQPTALFSCESYPV